MSTEEFATNFGRMFLDKLKKSKSSLVTTGYSKIKVRKTDNPLTKILYSEEKCHYCKRELYEKRLIVKFKTEKRFTIFEADMLWMILIEGKKPKDYADFHKCIAGKEFIENIESYRLGETR